MALDMKDHMTLERDSLVAHSLPHFCAVSRRNALLILRHLNTSEEAEESDAWSRAAPAVFHFLEEWLVDFTESRRQKSHHVE